MTDYEYIQVAREMRKGGEIATITLNRPKKLNAMSTAMNHELRKAAHALSKDKDLRAVVLTGAGDKAFVGGADIDEMSELDAPSAREFITNLHRAINEVRMLPMPVIGRINGFCLGAGLELAAVCDMRVAEEGTKLGMPEVRVGMPSVIEAVLLPRIMGWGKAAEILLTGDMIDAQDAKQCGLIQQVTPKGRIDDQVEAWLESLLASGPQAVRIQKRLMRQWENLPIDAAIRSAIDAFEESHSGPEPKAYLSRFTRKG
ncbi:enoyl-CoA hydratase [Minwuia sp.]|uniref:enoyl-CoA hydratase n=1 Tax=Minwuia sp. TaxID=2493630 RepID=UPI003A93AA5F